MLDKFLRDVVVLVVGKPAEPIADLLHSNKHENEFTIAKKLDLTINQTRNILYKIADYGLVSSIRKKDKRKGWYTYFWKLEVLKSLEFLKGVLIKRISQVKNQLKSRETKQFYVCELCNVEFNEEKALLKDFTCSECGSVFVLKDNSPIIKELKKNITRLENELVLVDEEIKKEQEKQDKKIQRELKKEKKQAQAKRKASAKKRAAKRKANLEKAKKSSVKKKSVKKKVAKKTAKKPKKKKVKKVTTKASKKKPVKKVKKSVKKKPSKKSLKKKVVKKKKAKKK